MVDPGDVGRSARKAGTPETLGLKSIIYCATEFTWRDCRRFTAHQAALRGNRTKPDPRSRCAEAPGSDGLVSATRPAGIRLSVCTKTRRGVCDPPSASRLQLNSPRAMTSEAMGEIKSLFTNSIKPPGGSSWKNILKSIRAFIWPFTRPAGWSISEHYSVSSAAYPLLRLCAGRPHCSFSGRAREIVGRLAARDGASRSRDGPPYRERAGRTSI